MGRSANKDSEVAAPTPERRSLRHSKPSEDEVKASPPTKGRRSVGKKKEEKAESKDEDDVQEAAEDNHNDDSIVSSGDTEPETSNSKPVTPKTTRGTRKRPASEEADVEEVEEEKEDKDKKSEKDSSEMKNGKADGVGKGKPKKKRKPPTKKKKEEQDESEMWTPLEPLEGDEKKDAQKKTQSKSDRRKQALVERQAPAEPMLQKQLPRQRRNSGASECVVLDGAPHSHRRSKTIVTVDIDLDDDLSETGSIQIVAEPDVDSVFDFKRLLIQCRNVNLPSSLWGVHKDPRNQFVSFTRFNPDYPDTNGIFADRAVVFKSSLNPEVFINGVKIELPEMFTVVETLYETSQVIQFANNTVSPMGHASEEPADATS